MRLDKLNEFLMQDTKQERWHREHPGVPSKRYETMDYIMKDDEKVFFFDFSEEMMIEDLMIIKETRYAKLYPHFHKYMELNYVYEGECKFTINDKEIRLTKGDICLLQPNVIHSALPKQTQDIVLNMAFSDKFSTLEMFDSMNHQPVMSKFLQSYFDKTRQQDEFLVFKHMEDTMLGDTLLNIFFIYFSERAMNYDSMMKAYLKLLFLHLANATMDQALSNVKEENDEVIFHVLRYINTNYASCSLQSIADTLGYNYTYLGNLIKKKTGKTFTEIKQEQQLETAKRLIVQSRLPIYKIIERCGFHNQTFFYHRFEEAYGCMPTDLRK